MSSYGAPSEAIKSRASQVLRREMKQGDKVRVKTGNKFEGRTGTVTAASQNGKTVEVEFNDEATAWHSFVEQELETIG
jgi:hypothetical protein